MFDHKRRWDPTLDFDWEYIMKEWNKYWDLSKTILLEKSPPNIIRATSINKTFPNSYFVIFFRNPYAHCESLIRRNASNPAKAAGFTIKCLKFQKQNLLASLNSMKLSYEELTNSPDCFKKRIIEFLPELKNLDVKKEFKAHNFKNKNLPIIDLNTEKINKLSQFEIDKINEVFRDNIDLLEYFNYELINKHIPMERSSLLR